MGPDIAFFKAELKTILFMEGGSVRGNFYEDRANIQTAEDSNGQSEVCLWRPLILDLWFFIARGILTIPLSIKYIQHFPSFSDLARLQNC